MALTNPSDQLNVKMPAMDTPHPPPCPSPGSACLIRPDTAPLLSGHGVDLWLCAYRDGWDSPALASLLSEAELQRAQRFHFADDRLRYGVTRAAVRHILSRYVPVPPSEWHFRANEYGRPAISPDQPGAHALDFNVSHTAGLIVIAVGRRELGVDVESLARPAALALARRFFAPTETAALASVAPAQQAQAFYAYWTLKEAYVKARGMGLALPLDGFGFDLAIDGHIGCWINADLGDDPVRWWFARWELHAGYAMALCARLLNDKAPRLTLRQLDSSGGEHIVSAPPLACTALPPPDSIRLR